MKNINKIWQYVKPYKWYAFGNISFNIIQIFFSLSALALIIPFLGILFEQQELISKEPELSFNMSSLLSYFNYYISKIIIESGKSSALKFVSFIVIISILLKNLFIFLAKFFEAYLRNGIIQDIRNVLYVKILELSLSFYSDEKKGDIISRISNDVKEVENSIMKSIETISREPFTIIFYLGILIWMSSQLTIFLLVLLPVSGIIIGIIGKSLRKKSKKAQTKLGELFSGIEETLSGLRIIKAFNAEEKMKTNFFSLNKVYTKLMTALTRRQLSASPVSEFLGVIVMIIIMYYGGTLVLNNESNLSPSEFIGYIVIFSQIINPAKKFSTAFYDIRKGYASIDRISEILKADIDIKEIENPIIKENFESEIEFKNVSFKYEDEYVLKNINLTIPKGKTIALVGQSGSGKSTLVDLIPRFYDIEEGEILIDKINVKNLSIKSLRELMGNVNQEPILFNDTIGNNISFGVNNADNEQITEAAKIANAHYFISETEKKYNTNIGDRGSKLSGGQRQRLSIARAVFKNPPIMILDEATSSLDTESEKLVQDALYKLMKNRTSIVIAHRLSTVKSADLICVLNEGEIIEKGTHNELIKLNGNYKKLYDLQMF
ncbi:MAG: ABC transporter ATP-binding protein/permease [Bacteroidales bacterium]|nr:ABC transporter ATP-binding protein/permease [Bacteroidales bacterium]